MFRRGFLATLSSGLFAFPPAPVPRPYDLQFIKFDYPPAPCEELEKMYSWVSMGSGQSPDLIICDRASAKKLGVTEYYNDAGELCYL